MKLNLVTVCIAALAVTMPLAVVAADAPVTMLLTDLGTLGGSTSDSFATAINNNGQVVGWSRVADDSVHGFLWTPDRGMIDITAGGPDTRPNALSESGQVVGTAFTAASGYRAFSWTAATGIIDLASLPGAGDSFASAVNSKGDVVGQSGGSAVLWRPAGDPLDLGTFPNGRRGAPVFGTDVNDLGQVVGAGWTAEGEQHPFLWTAADGMADLGTLGGPYASASAINEAGQVIGGSSKADGSFDGFIWTAARGLVDLGNLGGGWSSPVAVSNSGQVVGSSMTSSYDEHAFSWTDDRGLVDLGTLGGSFSRALAVNAKGEVVGFSSTADEHTHAFWWSADHGMVDLGGGSWSHATGINDLGQVVGFRSIDVEPPHAVIWNPATTYVFHGFFQPVDNDGVTNVVTAGKAVPVKFDLNGDRGLDIFAAGYPRTTATDCAGGAPTDAIEQTVTAGSSQLVYDASVNAPIGLYTYVWKTDRDWAGSCRQLQVRLKDGQLFTANFRFLR